MVIIFGLAAGAACLMVWIGGTAAILFAIYFAIVAGLSMIWFTGWLTREQISILDASTEGVDPLVHGDVPRDPRKGMH